MKIILTQGSLYKGEKGYWRAQRLKPGATAKHVYRVNDTIVPKFVYDGFSKMYYLDLRFQKWKRKMATKMIVWTLNAIVRTHRMLTRR